MDETLRNLERAAATGDPLDRLALFNAQRLLGEEPAEPAEPPTPGPDPRAVDQGERTASLCWDWGGQPSTRRQAAARASSKARRRRAMRRARKASCRDWELWE